MQKVMFKGKNIKDNDINLATVAIYAKKFWHFSRNSGMTKLDLVNFPRPLKSFLLKMEYSLVNLHFLDYWW